MFTGIVEELGEVVGVTDQVEAARITIRGPVVLVGTRHGDSIAVNGVCLTVADADPDDATFTADVMAETLRRSSLSELRAGSPVNLERPVTPTGRLGGHLVQGHVDGTGTITARESSEHWDVVRISLPAGLARYVVSKGSITVDGVSLTVVDVGDDSFSVCLIPATLATTTLGRKQVGDPVNIEVDVLAKYVEKLLAANGARGIESAGAETDGGTP